MFVRDALRSRKLSALFVPGSELCSLHTRIDAAHDVQRARELLQSLVPDCDDKRFNILWQSVIKLAAVRTLEADKDVFLEVFCQALFSNPEDCIFKIRLPIHTNI